MAKPLFEPYKVGTCFTYKIKEMNKTNLIMQITAVMYWPGDKTASYFAIWLGDASSAERPMYVKQAVLNELYDHCPAAEILYGV